MNRAKSTDGWAMFLALMGLLSVQDVDVAAHMDVAASLECEPAEQLQTSMPSDGWQSIETNGIVSPQAFQLRWLTLREVYGRMGLPDLLAVEAGDQPVLAVDQIDGALANIVIARGEEPIVWAIYRISNLRAGRRFSLQGHNLTSGSVLTVYPDDGYFVLTLPADEASEPHIGVLIVRGPCTVDWRVPESASDDPP